ncbi:MAG: C45 family peptidase, partial [Sandaracinaceae bacterium]|nr:C45 family peptidase [Sandaracinaceae bacterium]
MMQVHASTPPRRDDLTREGRGWLRKIGDVHVLKVAGSFYEMGRQHGALLKDEIAQGPIPYYRTVVEKLLGRSALGPLSPLAWTLLQRTVGRRVADRVPEFALETIRGLADGAGMPFEQFLDGCTMPDSVVWVASRAMTLKGHGPAVAHRLQLGLGCTSAVAWGEATKDGALLHARNFDYHGVGPWPRTKAVIFHEPDRGQRYVSVAAAGVGLGGITAMNEAGLTLTVHQHMFTDRAALGGVPIGIVGDVVMRDAESLEDARKILEEHRPIGCWTYVVTDGKRREVMALEESPERKAVIRAEGKNTFGYANIYVDRELGKTEVDYYGSYWRHNQGRYRAVHERLEAQEGALDPQAMAEILADTGDPRCRIRNSIAMVMTVGSVVFRPEDGMVWVGTGEAPTSHGTFQPFSLRSEDHAPEHGTLRTDAGRPRAELDAFERYRRAFVTYMDDEDPRGAAAHLAQACELEPEQPVYWSVRGLCALQSGDATGAEACFDRAIAIGHP